MSGLNSPRDAQTRSNPTRILVIIKNHALEHRLAIERRIQEASFEIIKERQMEFDENCDHDYLQELFGNDAHSLFEGPVWVYVLERRRAVEVWSALMGDEDPTIAKDHSPNSLRAVYGISIEQNAVMGSSDIHIAEEQISCVFQSSPLFPPQDFAHAGDEFEDVDDVEHHMNGSHAHSHSWSETEQMLMSPSSHSQHSAIFSDSGSRKGGSVNGSSTTSHSNSGKKDSNGKTPFKARPLPKTTHVPESLPRTTRAAQLRAGKRVEPSVDKPRVAPTREEQIQTFLDVPGHKRSSIIHVASTAPPTVAPRMTRAASLRIGGPVKTPSKQARPRTAQDDKSKIFEGVPGHKRRESISVASVQQPTVTPRLNRSAELRAKKDTAPPSSFMFRRPTTPKLPGSVSRPGSSMGNNSSATPGGRQTISRASSRVGLNSDTENVAPRLMPPRPPSIEPRTNRSALLRTGVKGGANVHGNTALQKATQAKVNRALVV